MSLEIERIVEPESFGSPDLLVEQSLRPQTFDQFIGQRALKDNLAVYIEAARRRGEALDHCLFAGPPGLGKTTLAYLVAKTIGSELFTISGPALDKKGDLAAVLTNLKPNDVLFIDEIHRVPIAVEEVLYSAMEDFKLDIILGQGPGARTMRIDLPKFTLIGATTRAGLRLRRDHAELFTSYDPVEARGEAAEHLVAFDRGGALTVATRLPLGLAQRGGWGDTELVLPAGRWWDHVTDRDLESDGTVLVGEVLDVWPVAMLTRIEETQEDQA